MPCGPFSCRARRRGAALVQLTLCLAVVLSMMAVTLDGGILLTERRRVQAAADAAALAAVADLFKYYATNAGADSTGNTARQSALNTALADGYPNSEVTVRIPPTTGDHIGQPGYAEVIIDHAQRRYFSTLWGSSTITVSARAVARSQWATGTATAANIGVLLTKPSGTSLSNNGGGNGGGLVLSSGAFIVKSTGPNVTDFSGNKTFVTANVFNFASSQSNSGSISNDPNKYLDGPGGSAPTVNFNQAAPTDPYSSLPVPSIAGLNLASRTYSGQTTIDPGVYSGGISIGNNSVSMKPGIYYVQGSGISLSGGGSLDGTSGVFIYISPTSGTNAISMSGNPVVDLNPINTGTYKGISIFVDRSASSPVVELKGTAAGDIVGTIYAPSAKLTISGTVGLGGSQLIADSMEINGNASVGAGKGPAGGQSTTFQLVE